MFQNINDRLLEKLFIKKEVNLGQKQYLMYYNRIWPCEESFIRFLKVESTQDQIEQAKNIVARMNFIANFPVPQSFFENLIGVEERGDDSKSAKSSGYVGQDHVIHSINLYILGIYFFFNLPLFYNRLLDFFRSKRPYRSSFEAPIENQTKAFLTAWRYFAFCHDIGYVFEREDIPSLDEKMWNSYNQMENEILYDLFIKAMARILFAGMICKRSNYKFALDDQEVAFINSQEWRNLEGKEIITKDSIIGHLQNNFGSHYRLANINSYCGLQQLLPFIDTKKLFTIIRDEQMKVVVIHYWNENMEEKLFYVKDLPFDKDHIKSIWRIGCEEFVEEGYQCEYYVPSETKDNVFKQIQDQALNYLPRFIEKHFAHCLTLSPNDQSAENTIYKIARQIKIWVPFEAFLKNEVFYSANDTITRRENEEIKRCLKKNIISAIDESQLSGDIIESRIEDCISNLRFALERDTLKRTIFEAVNCEVSTDPRGQITSSLHDFFQEKIPSLKRSMSAEMAFKVKVDTALQVCEDIFTGKQNDDRVNLQNFLKDKAKDFNIDYNEFISYQGFYQYDHGVMSAKLLARAIEINRDACRHSQREEFLKSAWPIENNMTESFVFHKDAWLHEETIFSILLHNIWVKSPDFHNGIQYMQDISVDPFSYFCAFCDNVQLWDRRQLINMAKTSPAGRYHAAQPFDIAVEGNTIHIICQTENILKFLESKIAKMNEYLRDASYLIKVTVTQSFA